MWTKPIFNLYVTKQLCNIFAQITRLNFLINNVNLTSLLNQITYFKENSSIIDNLKFIPDAEISKKDQKGDEELIRKPWGAAQAKDWVLIPKSEAETGYNAPSQRSLWRKAPCTTSADSHAKPLYRRHQRGCRCWSGTGAGYSRGSSIDGPRKGERAS